MGVMKEIFTGIENAQDLLKDAHAIIDSMKWSTANNPENISKVIELETCIERIEKELEIG